jgi:hypothetical protein
VPTEVPEIGKQNQDQVAQDRGTIRFYSSERLSHSPATAGVIFCQPNHRIDATKKGGNPHPHEPQLKPILNTETPVMT